VASVLRVRHQSAVSRSKKNRGEVIAASMKVVFDDADAIQARLVEQQIVAEPIGRLIMPAQPEGEGPGVGEALP
jgi:hypothetical protein